MIQYGLTIENQQLIQEKAKSKRDGVYDFRGVSYRVRDKQVTYFACGGQILQYCFGFNCVVGSYEGYSDSRKASLKGIQ